LNVVFEKNKFQQTKVQTLVFLKKAKNWRNECTGD